MPETLTCHRFGSQGVGIDLYTDPGDLPLSGLTQAYNMYIDGTVLRSRPAIVGLLTTPMANPIYRPFPYIKSDGTEYVIFCSGPASSTTGGKIYQVAATGGTATELLDASNSNASFNINAEAFEIVLHGGYAYMVWGASLYRTNLSASTASAVSSLNPPVVAPSASLTNIAVDSLSSATGWTPDTVQTTRTITDLVIGGTNTLVSSALQPFQQSDIGKTLTIVSGTGFTPGTRTISAVASTGVATLSGSAGTINSTGGTASLPEITVGANMVPNGQTDIEAYSGGTIHGGNDIAAGVQIGNSWIVVGDQMSFNGAGGSSWALNTVVPATYNSTAHTWMNVNDPLSGVRTLPICVSPLASPNGYRYVNQFYGRYSYVTTDTNSKNGFNVVVTAYSDVAATTAIATAQDTFIPLYSGQSPGQTHDFMITFPGVTTAIRAITVLVQGAASNVDLGVGVAYPCCANLFFSPVAYAAAGVNGRPTGLSLTAQSPGVLVNHGEPTNVFVGALAGSRITKDYGGTLQNWSVSPVITFNLSTAPGSPQSVQSMVTNGLSMSLVLRTSGSNTEYTAPLAFAADGSYMTTDLSAYIPVSVYASFEYIELSFNSNVTTTQTTAGIFVITSITQAGNLPISQSGVSFRPITYIVEEMYSFGDATYSNPLESSGGPVSNSITSTPVFAVGQLVVPVPVNTLTTAYAIFRGGGTFTDGQYRLIATVPTASDYVAPISYSDLVIGANPNQAKVSSVLRPFIAGDVGKTLYILAGSGFTTGPYTISSVSLGVATLSAAAGTASSTGGIAQLGGDPLIRDLQNPYVTWNHTTRTLTDNTPDSFLNFSLTLQYGRNLPPTTCNHICYHQDRIWVASAQTLSSSWSLVADIQNGVYFTNVRLDTDPYAEVKGVTFSVNPGDNDNIMSMISAGSSMLVLKNRSAAVVDGYNPTNFACQTYLNAAGTGNVASKAAILCGAVTKAWFLGSNNVYEFDGDVTNPKSIPIQPVLHPSGLDGGATISSTLYGKSAMMFYDLRLHLFAPQAGSTQNSVDYVYDFRNGCWSTWGLAMTSGASLTGASTDGGAFMGGYDGQLYTFAAGGDKATPAATATGVPWSMTPRAFGQETPAMDFLEQSCPSRMYCMGTMGETTALTLFCYADTNSSVQFAQSYTVTAGRFVVGPKVTGVQGLQIFAGVSGSSTVQATIRAVGIDNEKRKVQP